MYRNVEVLRLLPDRPGRGGTKFGYHSFQQQPINDTRDVKNVHVWQDSWRSDSRGYSAGFSSYVYPDNEAIGSDQADALVLHSYAKFSLSAPGDGPSTELFGHNAHPSYGGHIWDYTRFTNGTLDMMVNPPVWSGTTHVICPASPTYPAVFVNIGNRCFIARGEYEGIIYDSSRQSPTFSVSGPPSVYAIGVGAPTAAPVILAADVVKQAEIYLRKTSVYISHPDPNSALSTAVSPGTDTLEIHGDGVDWTGANRVNILAGSMTTIFPTGGMTVSIDNGSYDAYIYPPLSIPTDNEWVGLTLTVNGFSFTMMAFANASPTEVPPIPAGACRLLQQYQNGVGDVTDSWDPSTNIIHEPFTVTGVRWTMQKGGIDKAWVGGLSGENTVSGTLVNAGGMLTWDTVPPSYAYAWYDPITGHISNISPVFATAETSKTNTGIRINVDASSISYPPSTSILPTTGTRWTHILFFRTLMAGGSTLYPIGSLSPTIPDPDIPGAYIPNPEWKGLPDSKIQVIPPSTTGNYWYDSSRDSELLISGALRAPQFTNGKPKMIQNGREVVLFPAHMAYWDGRLWTACTQDPAALHYSCDRVQCPFGVPEESFPDTNVLRIPASDGCIRGMKLIGEALLITTERWAYTIAGNNEANYRLVRISTWMAGVGDYQMEEFTPDVEGQTALVVFIGTDGRVYAMPLGGQAVWISKEIQPFLDAADLSIRGTYRLTRVHCMSVAGRRLALVYCPAWGGAAGKTFIYDFDNKVWTENTLANDAYTDRTGMGTAWTSATDIGQNALELYATPDVDVTPPISPNALVTVKRWFYDTPNVPIPSGYVRTFPLNFDGKKTRKQIHFVRVYVNDQSFQSQGQDGVTRYPWRCTVRTDSDGTGYTATFGAEGDTAYDLLSGGSPVDASTAKERIVFAPALNAGSPVMGYTFDITVLFPDQTNKIYRLYAMDIGWTTVSEQQVDP